MQIVLIKFRAILFFVLILSVFYGSDVFSMGYDSKFNSYTPFSAEHQKMLDEVVEKFNVGNPGDFKGYIDDSNSSGHIKKKNKVVVGRAALNMLSTEELKFSLGREIYNSKIDKEKIFIKTVEHTINCRLVCREVGSSMAFLLIPATKNYSSLASAGICCMGLVTGFVMGGFVADYLGYDIDKCVSLALQAVEYEADKKVVETFKDPQAAISLISKLVDNSDQKIKTFPSKEERIARIYEEWIQQKQQ